MSIIIYAHFILFSKRNRTRECDDRPCTFNICADFKMNMNHMKPDNMSNMNGTMKKGMGGMGMTGMNMNMQVYKMSCFLALCCNCCRQQ